MQIVVAAPDGQWEELVRTRPQVEWRRVNDSSEFVNHPSADAFFNLTGNRLLAGHSIPGKPVIVNSVVETLGESNAPENVLRINGWPGFLQRPAWEISGKVDGHIKAVFETLNIRLHVVADEPGFISARIIAMIVNEAYLAVSDEVSTREEIDTAMKLGTNYPHGPFEWAASIGKGNILALLEKLYLADKRYQPADLLIKEATKK